MSERVRSSQVGAERRFANAAFVAAKRECPSHCVRVFVSQTQRLKKLTPFSSGPRAIKKHAI
jgi:hypothetical protein